MVEARSKNAKKVFFSGVLLLSLSTILVKIIGLIYKIPMLSYLGAEGMGYFNSAYEIYALFCVISTAGLPVALSVMISGAVAQGNSEYVGRIYRSARTVFFLVGILGTGIMAVFARQFCLMIRSENAYGCILSIAPTVFFVCISSALRGYFQGYQRMLPTAVSQMIEAVGKLLFGLLLARFALAKGYQTAEVAAFAGWGLTIGTACSTLYLMIEKIRFQKAMREETGDRMQQSSAIRAEADVKRIWKQLAALSIPMTLGAALVSMTKLIDMTMILRRLQSIGYSDVMANEAYGSYTTLALSVYGLLPTLVNSIALPLIPMLSAAIASGDRERQTQMVDASFRLTSLFAIPAALGVSAFAKPMLLLLFGNEPEAVATAAPLLSCLGVSVFLSCMITATNSVLHAYQSVNRPILSMLLGAVIKMISAYFLIGNANVALMGAPISTFLCNAVVVLLNLSFSAKQCGTIEIKRIFMPPLYAAVVSVGISYGVYLTLHSYLGENAIVVLCAILLVVLLYLVTCCLFGAFRREDLAMLPMGNKICTCLDKMRLLPPQK